MRRALAIVALGLMAGACAPHVVTPPRLEPEALRLRFERARTARDQVGRGIDGDVVLRVGGEAMGSLPAMSATVVLAGPDAARVRVRSAFGTALDVAARGDSLTAFVPARHLALELGAASDTLGMPIPGPLAYRLWSATWAPPGDAWRSGTVVDSLIVLRWTESGDSLALGIAPSGLPRRVEWERPGSARVVCDYPAWAWVRNTAWPSRIEFEDVDGAVRVSCTLSQLRAAATPARARTGVRLPDGVERVEWSALRRWIEQWRGL